MNVSRAIFLAREWVGENASGLPGFAGAYLAGSVNDLAADSLLPDTSDLDVMVVLDVAVPPTKPGKFRYRGVLLEVTFLPLTDVRTPEQVLGHYHLAGAFRGPGILADPDGHLSALQGEVSRGFSQRVWVERRCEQATVTVLQRLDSVDTSAPFHAQVVPWLFAAGGLPHILLVAGLRNPTVRRRYSAVRELLVAYDQGAVYRLLLRLLGAEKLDAARLAHHLEVLGAAFDAAAGVIMTPFSFAADISQEARAVAIDGSREMIDAGDHREAVFWIVATFSRCMQVFDADAPLLAARWEPAYRELLADLGIRSEADLWQGCGEIRDALPGIVAVARRIMDANPDMVG